MVHLRDFDRVQVLVGLYGIQVWFDSDGIRVLVQWFCEEEAEFT
jgi:hypothetical protein